VCRHHPVGLSEVTSYVGDLQGRRVARKDRMLGSCRIQPLEDTSLQLQILGDRLNHEVCLRRRLLEIRCCADALKRPLRGYPADPSRLGDDPKVRPDLPDRAGEEGLIDVVEHDLAPAKREHLGNAVTHEAGADHCGVPDLSLSLLS